MNGKIATILILLMCTLNLIPPLFAGNKLYFDNVYYSLLYLLLSFLAISLPFMVTTLNKHLNRISFLVGGWFVFGLIFELINFFIPNVVLNNESDGFLFAKFLTIFTIAVAFNLTHDQWKRMR
jgi:Na+/melibiose symporter-like transporter